MAEDESLIPKDPSDRVGPGMKELLKEKAHHRYENTRNHMHVGFRWQPYIDQPKNSEFDIERELGKWEAMQASGICRCIPCLRKKPRLRKTSIEGGTGHSPCSKVVQGTGHQDRISNLASSLVDEWGRRI